MLYVTASGFFPLASGSNTVAAIGVLIPLILVLLITAVPLYFRMSERRRRREGEQEIQQQGEQRDLAAEVEELRRRQAGE